MKRTARYAALSSTLFALAGCETNLDGGGNEDGAGGAGGAGATVASSSSMASPAGGSAECSSTEGLPVAERILNSSGMMSSISVNDDQISLAQWGGRAEPSALMRISRAGDQNEATDYIDDGIFVMHEVDGTLFGGGACNGGGTVYAIGDEATFDPVVEGCSDDTTHDLAVNGDRIYFDRANQLLTSTIGGGGDPAVLFELPVVDGHAARIDDVATAGTDVFVGVAYGGKELPSAWTEIWRIASDGGAPQQLVKNPAYPAPPGVQRWGEQSIVVDGEHVYFLDGDGGRVSRVGKHGGDVETLWQGQHRLRQLIDAGAELAFIEYEDPEGQDCTPILRTLPKSGGDAEAVAIMPEHARHLTIQGTTVFALGDETGENYILYGLYRFER